MQEIFISYRHDDTAGWAAELGRDLVRAFGRDSLFLDQRDDSLPWGSRWPDEIDRAASRCEAMLVLMGPQWIDGRGPDGQRRLLAAQDWVRHEVQLGLAHGALVLPVLFEGGRVPAAAELPPELQPLLDTMFNAEPITNHNWEREIPRLVGVLAGRQVLKNLHDLCTARTGIVRLRELMAARPDVLLALAGSRDAVKRTAEQVRTLRLLKDVHDALHGIEHHCLEPIRIAAADTDLSLYEIDLAEPATEVHAAAVALGAGRPQLIALDAQLGVIARLLHDTHSPKDRARLVEELEKLISQAPDMVDGLISTTAMALDVGALVELLGTVRKAMSDQAPKDAELAPLLGLADAIEGLHRHLVLLVGEHGLLQALDLTLRAVCRGNAAPESAEGEAPGPDMELLRQYWASIDQPHLALHPPHSEELLKCGLSVLQSFEQRLRGAMAAGEAGAAWTAFQTYFEAVGKVFWSLDSRLKAFCQELDEATGPLRTILAQLEERHD